MEFLGLNEILILYFIYRGFGIIREEVEEWLLGVVNDYIEIVFFR